MRKIGFSLIAVGVALLLYFGFSYFKNRDKLISPVPDEKGIKVIIITPSKDNE